MSLTPTIGRIVLYKLSESDANDIKHRRGAAQGNVPHAGEVYPAVVVRSWGGPSVNLQVFLDGPDSYWAPSRKEGTVEGCWTWPRLDASGFTAPTSP
jgi:hypothetical protein